jgi:hypothetical protein
MVETGFLSYLTSRYLTRESLHVLSLFIHHEAMRPIYDYHSNVSKILQFCIIVLLPYSDIEFENNSIKILTYNAFKQPKS